MATDRSFACDDRQSVHGNAMVIHGLVIPFLDEIGTVRRLRHGLIVYNRSKKLAKRRRMRPRPTIEVQIEVQRCANNEGDAIRIRLKQAVLRLTEVFRPSLIVKGRTS